MDWSSTDWTAMDELYAPKRKVSRNKRSAFRNIVGKFHSHKMARIVEYESLGERMYYFYHELDQKTVRYYVQPIRVPIFAGQDQPDDPQHTPDVLSFRNGYRPLLSQVKFDPDEVSKDFERKNRACERYAAEHGWEYRVVYPSTLPPELSRNLRFLKTYIDVRSYYPELFPHLMHLMQYVEQTTTTRLARNFMDVPRVIPAIYHLIARGVFRVDVMQEIGPDTTIQLNECMSDFQLLEGWSLGAI